MKKTALLAAAAALMGATPAIAAEGYIGARYETGNVDTGGSDDDFDGWQGEFALGEHNDSFGLQFGGGIGAIGGDAADDDGFMRFDGHVYWQVSPGARLGAVVATTSVEDADLKEFVYGLEGNFDVGANTDIWASGTLGEIELFGVDVNTWNVDGGADFYLNPNFRLGGNVGVGHIDDADIDTFSAGVSAEFQPSSLPVSIYGSWQTFNADGGGGGDSDASAISVGVRLNFGPGSNLQERNNSLPFRAATSFVGRIFDLGTH